jgi:hypothetical protein
VDGNASKTCLPAGMTSRPIPSPGMRPMVRFFVAVVYDLLNADLDAESMMIDVVVY